MELKIKNWEIFQHYKDRNPPWIKLHVEILSSRTWVALDDASRVLAIASMVIASKNEGWVPIDRAYMKRVAYLNSEPDFKPLIEAGFFDIDTETLADASTILADARPETEERQRRGENIVRGISKADFTKPDDVNETVWDDFLKLRRAKRAAVTETAINGIRREADKAGMTLEAAMQEMCANGWQGFKADWINRKGKTDERTQRVKQGLVEWVEGR